jgi:hypothetical protein
MFLFLTDSLKNFRNEIFSGGAITPSRSISDATLVVFERSGRAPFVNYLTPSEIETTGLMHPLSSGNQTVDHHGVPGGRVGAGPDEGRQLRGDAHRHNPPRGPQRPRLPAQREEAASGHQSRQRPPQRDGRRETGRLRRGRSADQHDQQAEHVRRDALLDGAGGDQAIGVRLEGGHLESGHNRHRAGQRRTPQLRTAPDAGALPHSQKQSAPVDGELH